MQDASSALLDLFQEEPRLFWRQKEDQWVYVIYHPGRKQHN